MTFPEWSHVFKATRTSKRLTKEYGPGAQISVKAGLHYIRGNSRPYFSVTAEITTNQSRRRNDCETCGCLHEYILRFWPALAPVVALHGSDDQGEPMHANADGLYHLGIGAYSKWDRVAACRHFRLSSGEVDRLRNAILSGEGYDSYYYAASVDVMRVRWAKEADLARQILDGMAKGTN